VQRFQRPQIGLDLANLSGGSQMFFAYSVVSLSLW